MLLSLVVLLWGWYTCSWYIAGRGSKKIAPQLDDQLVTITIPTFNNSVNSIYSFYGAEKEKSWLYIGKVKNDHQQHSFVASQRVSSSSQSFFELFKQQYPEKFSTFPRDIAIMNIFINMAYSLEMPYVEISIMGDIDYALYEIDDNRVVPVLSKPKNVIVFDSPEVRGEDGQRRRDVLEVRFQLERKTYIVLGCKAFWAVMSSELITPLLRTTEPMEGKVESVIQAACIRQLTSNSQKSFSEEEAAKRCMREKVNGLESTIACIILLVYDDNSIIDLRYKKTNYPHLTSRNGSASSSQSRYKLHKESSPEKRRTSPTSSHKSRRDSSEERSDSSSNSKRRKSRFSPK